MNSRRKVIPAKVIACLLFLWVQSSAQTNERMPDTWPGPDLSQLTNLLKRPSTGPPPSVEVVRFSPQGDSGVPRTLAAAFGRSPEERAALTVAFQQVKKGYDAEVAKKGKSNNLAAAMAFFIAANVTAYHQADAPGDEAGENLFDTLQVTMASTPAIVRLTNAEKQQMHDWLVCMAGFVITGHMGAKKVGDLEGLQNFRTIADQSLRLVLSVDVNNLRFTKTALAYEGSDTPQASAGTNESRIVGVWSISVSNPPSSNLVSNAGYFKSQYQFKADGTYTFKSERWFGYSRSKEFYTTEESGSYSVSGNSLTVSPTVSLTTLRNPEGALQKTRNNQLERITYKWQTHYFEGINETQLVLQPAKETTRDGVFTSSSVFANSYLYSSVMKLEWRF